MNMKKLINDSDLDNLEELSKKWRRAEEPSNRTLAESYNIETVIPTTSTPGIREKQNIATKQNMIGTTSLPSSKQNPKMNKEDAIIELEFKKLMEKKTHSHTPHVIDQDTEHFKVRLEHLLNVFKTDAVSEFMAMKRSMLDDQREQVRADTQKYLRMYEQKHSQLILTRDNLIGKTRQCEIKDMRCEKMAILISKQKEKNRILKYLATPFALLVRYREYRRQKKIKQQRAKIANEKMLMKKAIGGWSRYYKDQSNLKRKEYEQKKLQQELNEITGKYQKQITLLREKLQQATSKVDEFQRNKTVLQQNLKKAFMRGVCAMNFEAMSALQGQPGQQFLNELKQSKAEQILMNNNSSLSFGRKEDTNNLNLNVPIINNSINNTNKSVVFFNQPKSESKDHKWREAPITQNPDKQTEQIQPITVIPQLISQQQGKVIRVINGKSTTVTQQPKVPMKKTSAVGTQKIITVSSNSNNPMSSTRKR